jgi:hypothetical protein
MNRSRLQGSILFRKNTGTRGEQTMMRKTSKPDIAKGKFGLSRRDPLPGGAAVFTMGGQRFLHLLNLQTQA